MSQCKHSKKSFPFRRGFQADRTTLRKTTKSRVDVAKVVAHEKFSPPSAKELWRRQRKARIEADELKTVTTRQRMLPGGKPVASWKQSLRFNDHLALMLNEEQNTEAAASEDIKPERYAPTFAVAECLWLLLSSQSLRSSQLLLLSQLLLYRALCHCLDQCNCMLLSS